MDVQRSKRLAPVGLWTAAQALALGEREAAGLRPSPFSPFTTIPAVQYGRLEAIATAFSSASGAAGLATTCAPDQSRLSISSDDWAVKKTMPMPICFSISAAGKTGPSLSNMSSTPQLMAGWAASSCAFSTLHAGPTTSAPAPSRREQRSMQMSAWSSATRIRLPRSKAAPLGFIYHSRCAT